MMQVTRSADRGHTDIGWLDSHHSFSFGDFYDPRKMGFRALRVINEDRVTPATGFGTHPHRDMEIISYVVEGELGHKDSMGNGSVIRPGDVQRMSAGTGVLHSEMNPSRGQAVHFLQIWILPEKQGLKPSYEQKSFPESERRGKLRLLASRDGRDGSVTVHQDVSLYGSVLEAGERVEYALGAGRHAWVQVIKGGVTVNGNPLRAGDGAAVSDASALELVGDGQKAEVLLFDLA
jgi:hypothetical protein